VHNLPAKNQIHEQQASLLSHANHHDRKGESSEGSRSRRFKAWCLRFIEGFEEGMPTPAISNLWSSEIFHITFIKHLEQLHISGHKNPKGMMPNWHRGKTLLLDLM
jgi:hypothetical protein